MTDFRGGAVAAVSCSTCHRQWQLLVTPLLDITPVIQEAADNVDIEAKPAVEKFKKSRRTNMNYMEMGIPPGSQLKFRDADYMCTVIDGRRIEYEGEAMSLSALTDKIVQPGRPLRPTPLWSFNGKNLADIYEETYGED